MVMTGKKQKKNLLINIPTNILAMRKLFISTLLLSFFSCNTIKYYDGEGNEIPQQAVSLLVKSQFVIMTAKQDSVINQYFYFRNN